MIYIQDNIGRFVKREKNEMYTKMECTNQLTQSTFTINIPIKQPNGKFYQDIRVIVPNGSYDYSLYIGDKLAYTGIFTNIIEVEKKEVNNAYNVEYNTITYTPNQKPIEIPERVLEINKNGEYDVTNFDKANVLVTEGVDCEEVIKQLQEEITDLESDKADLEDAINTLENEVANLEGEIVDKEADIVDLQDQINTITTYTITSNGTYAPEAGVLGWNEVVVNVPSSSTDCEDVITDLTNQINTLEAEKQALQGQLDSALGEIANLQSQIEELNSEIAQLNAEIEGLLLENQELKNTVADLQEKVNSVTSITINEEGTYVAPEGILGWNEIIVDIQEPVEPFVPEYLYIYNRSSNYMNFSYESDGEISPNFEYSYDGVDWNVWNIYTDLRIDVNEKLYLRGVNNYPISNSTNHFSGDSTGCDEVEIGGNIMSLVDGEGRTNTIPANYMFSYLFTEFYYTNVFIPGSGGEYSTSRVDLYLDNLKLPATELTEGCYDRMFFNTDIHAFPKILPATTLKPYCYNNMFCSTSAVYLEEILDAPILMGKYLELGCYNMMFYNQGGLHRVACWIEDISLSTMTTNNTSSWLVGTATYNTNYKKLYLLAEAEGDWEEYIRRHSTSFNGYKENYIPKEYLIYFNE